MMQVPPPDEFYARRDDRTNKQVETPQYQEAALLIVGEREVLETDAGRELALTATNLVSRFGRDVDLAFPSVAPDAESAVDGRTLAGQCLRQMWAANPHGRFGWVREPTERAYDCIIAIGNPDVNAEATSTIHVDGSGWIGYVGRTEPAGQPSGRGSNPIGPNTAACLAVAEAFKTVNGALESALSEEIIYDAYTHEVLDAGTSVDHPTIDSPLNLGTVRMVGVGSVGSAAIRFLGRLPVEGAIQLVDHDSVELVNLNRSPLFRVNHALERTPKVEVAKEYLDHHGIESASYQLPYDEFEEQQPEQADIVLPLANERGVRSAIQHNRPPVMLHSTTSGAEVAVRRHIPINEACLLCHFPPEEPRVDAGCATAPVHSEDEADTETGMDAALPFASFLAGCFVAAELAKLPLGVDLPTDSLARILTLANLGEVGVLQYDKDPAEDCVFCSNSSPSVHTGQIDGTRFDHLTDKIHEN